MANRDIARVWYTVNVCGGEWITQQKNQRMTER